ncbi:MAG: S1 RNA-binding domain-containing protein [Phycisphaerae bacterium]
MMSDLPRENGSGSNSSAETPLGHEAANNPPSAEAAPASVSPERPAEPDGSLDREVEAALGSMDPGDLAELCGDVPIPGSTSGPTMEEIAPGTKMVGTVCGVGGDDVFLEFGSKSQAVVPRQQFEPDEQPKVGQRLQVVVERFDRDSNLLIVNREGAILRASWDTLKVGSLLKGRVSGLIKGGLEVNLNGIRGFMPASQADFSPMKDISVLLNEVLEVQVMEVNHRAKNLIVSRRKVLERNLREQREQVLAELKVGQLRKGVVGNITDFGAFVNLGGVDGLIHKSDLSYTMVEQVSDVLKPGDEVEVQVLKIDKDRNRISLGLKQTKPDPWEGVEERFPAGTALKARVIRLANFGAFAELEPGVEALIPISEMGWSRIRSAADVVSVGDMVDCAVMRVEAPRRRIALSMKQAQEDPWAGVLETFEEKSIVQGKVMRITDFGVFVQLAPGVEGLVHISELSDQRVRSCSDVVKVGEEISTRVLGVDKENRRISLSVRQVAAMAEDAEQANVDEPAKPPKKRKRDLRGGLSSHFDW